MNRCMAAISAALIGILAIAWAIAGILTVEAVLPNF